MFFCGPFGGSHAEASVFGPMGEGLEAVVISPAVEQISSSLGFGDPDSVWDLDDLPEFGARGHFVDQWSFNH